MVRYEEVAVLNPIFMQHKHEIAEMDIEIDIGNTYK